MKKSTILRLNFMAFGAGDRSVNIFVMHWTPWGCSGCTLSRFIQHLFLWANYKLRDVCGRIWMWANRAVTPIIYLRKTLLENGFNRAYEKATRHFAHMPTRVLSINATRLRPGSRLSLSGHFITTIFTATRFPKSKFTGNRFSYNSSPEF